MTTNYLINKETVSRYKQISENLSEEEDLNPYILQVQNQVIKIRMGNAFFTDIVKNYDLISVDPSKYKTLIEGGEYECNGKTFSFEGLGAAIAFYAYSEFIVGDQIQSTPFGPKIKTNEYSEIPSDKSIQRLSTQIAQIANGYLTEVEEFLAVNSEDYPLYTNCQKEGNTTGTFKISKIG